MADTAIIIGASGGIGSAICEILKYERGGTKVYRVSRSGTPDFYADIADENTLAAAASALQSRKIAPAMIIVATGILHANGRRPERSLRDLDAEWMAENYRINAIGPALVAKHLMPLMPKSGRTVFAVLSARVGSISDNRLGGWHGYRASKAALNMIVRNLSIEVQRKNPDAIVAALHPGTVDTALSAPFSGGGQNGERFTPMQSAAKLLAVLNQISAVQSGQIFDYDGIIIAP